MNSSDIGVTGKGCMVTVCECAVALFKYVKKHVGLALCNYSIVDVIIAI